MYHIRRKFRIWYIWKLVPARGRTNLYHTEKKFAYGTNESLFRLRVEEICTIYAKNFIYGTDRKFVQLREEQICTIQVKNIIYGTDFKKFQTFISKWQIVSFCPDILELQDNAGINQIPQMLRSCLVLNHWNFIESSIIRRIWYV